MSNTDSSALTVLFEDPHLLAIQKPAAMPVQADRTGDPDLLSILRATRREPSLELVHRIDRPVSGVVLLARTVDANARMNLLFRERSVVKKYLAIIEGALPGERNRWSLEHALQHDARAHRSRVQEPGGNDGALHRIQVVRIAQGDRYALIEVEPEGGAFHQIRAQLAAWGRPIKGDVKYGARRGEKDRSIALHARSISFKHPLTGAAIHLEAPVPDGAIWSALLALATLDPRP
jgi:23S rRNA pseudouridine1911/1915/1917 synthase